MPCPIPAGKTRAKCSLIFRSVRPLQSRQEHGFHRISSISTRKQHLQLGASKATGFDNSSIGILSVLSERRAEDTEPIIKTTNGDLSGQISIFMPMKEAQAGTGFMWSPAKDVCWGFHYRRLYSEFGYDVSNILAT
jgi:hypothetical protein